MLKRGFDLVMSALGLLVLFPLLTPVAALVKLEDGGPVFYRGLRIGRDGRPFRMVKFRTMVVDADRVGGPSVADDDPRMTRIGRVLRAWKLDELPQLVNVLKGDMSIVGPRPEVEQEVRLYTSDERAILRLRPGITDWASIRFRNEGQILNGSADPHETYRRVIRPEKIRLALAYVEHHSMATDLKILALTLRVIVWERNA